MNRRTFLRTLIWAGFSIKSNIFDFNLFIKDKLQKIKTIDISDESTEGGIVTCFIDGDILSKIEVEQCFESGRYSKKILLNKDGTIFRVDEVSTHYNVPFYITGDLAQELGCESFDINKSLVAKNTYHFRNNQVYEYASSSNETIDTTNTEEQCRNRLSFVLNKIKDPNHYV